MATVRKQVTSPISRLPLHEIAPISTMRHLPAAVAATAAAAQSFPPILPIRSGCPALRPDIRIGPGNSCTTGSRASDQTPSSRTWHLRSPHTWPARSNLGDVLQSLSLPFLTATLNSPREKRRQVCNALGPPTRTRACAPRHDAEVLLARSLASTEQSADLGGTLCPVRSSKPARVATVSRGAFRPCLPAISRPGLPLY